MSTSPDAESSSSVEHDDVNLPIVDHETTEDEDADAIFASTDENGDYAEEISNENWDWAVYFFGGDTFESEDTEKGVCENLAGC